MKKGKFHEQLGCYVNEIRYDFTCKIGTMFLCDGYTDMTACITLFESIDKKVNRIYIQQLVKQHQCSNMCYVKSNRKWQAFDLKNKINHPL